MNRKEILTLRSGEVKWPIKNIEKSYLAQCIQVNILSATKDFTSQRRRREQQQRHSLIITSTMTIMTPQATGFFKMHQAFRGAQTEKWVFIERKLIKFKLSESTILRPLNANLPGSRSSMGNSNLCTYINVWVTSREPIVIETEFERLTRLFRFAVTEFSKFICIKTINHSRSGPELV